MSALARDWTGTEAGVGGCGPQSANVMRSVFSCPRVPYLLPAPSRAVPASVENQATHPAHDRFCSNIRVIIAEVLEAKFARARAAAFLRVKLGRGPQNNRPLTPSLASSALNRLAGGSEKMKLWQSDSILRGDRHASIRRGVRRPLCNFVGERSAGFLCLPRPQASRV
jgi:hypothetical protein